MLPGDMSTTAIRLALLAAAFLLCAVACWPSLFVPSARSVLEGSPFEVSPGTARVVVREGPAGSNVTELAVQRRGDPSTPSFVHLPRHLSTAEVVRLDGSSEMIQLIPRSRALAAAAAALLLLISVPGLLLRKTRLPWYSLLAEPGGGFSLSRVQLLLWFAAAFVSYSALSLPICSFIPLTPQFAVLLGLSAATTVLGGALSPSAAQASTSAPVSTPTLSSPPPEPHPPFRPERSAASPGTSEVPPPDPADLVSDWRGNGDVTRYQYLLLSLVGAILLLLTVARELTLPSIPEQFLYLLAISQGTYVATKGVKAFPSK